MAYAGAGLEKFEKQGITADGGWYIKQPPGERASHDRGDVDCIKEVIAAKLYQYLLGDEVSPECKLVILKGQLTVASKYDESSPMTEVIQVKDIFLIPELTRKDVENLVKIYAAAYLLGEADLNIESIRVNQTQKFIKIDHDHSLTMGILPLDPESKNYVLDVDPVEDETGKMLSWCGLKDYDVKKALAALLRTKSNEEVDAFVKEVFLKFAALTIDEIKGFIAEAVKGIDGFDSGEVEAYLALRVTLCTTLLREHPENIIATSAQLAAPDAAVAGSPLLSPAASPMMNTVRTGRSDSSPPLSGSESYDGVCASSSLVSVVPCASLPTVVSAFYITHAETGAQFAPTAAGASRT